MTTQIAGSGAKLAAPVAATKLEAAPQEADLRSGSLAEPILPRFGGPEPAKDRFEDLLKPKAEVSSRPVSMMVTAQGRLAEQALKNRETADFRMMSQIAEEEEEEIPGNRDEITPEDDPAGYLQTLLDPAAPEATVKPGKEEPAVALADDGYKSDESFGDEFYQTMHTDLEGPERSGLKLEE